MDQDKQGSMTEQTSSEAGSSSTEFQHGVGQISSPEGAGMGGAAESSAQTHASAVGEPSSQSPLNPSPTSESGPSAGAHPTAANESPDVEGANPQLEVSTAREPGERGESKE